MRTAIAGFIAGALSVLIFHQFGFFIANELGLLKAQLYNMRPVPPLGRADNRLAGLLGRPVGDSRRLHRAAPAGRPGGLLGWMLFAGIIVTLVNWFIVLPIKGAPIGGGFRMPGVVVVPLVYAFWGFGMWLIYGLVRRALGGAKWND